MTPCLLPRRRASSARVAWCVLAALAAASCGDDAPAPVAPTAVPGPPPAAAPTFRPMELDADELDVVLVVALDAAPASVFSFTGGEHDTTPNLAAVADGGIVFEDHVLASTGLNAGAAALLTGRRSREHGVSSVREPGRARLRPAERTLAEAFAERGWRTLLAAAAPQLHPALSGLDQGFESIHVPASQERTRRADQVVGAALPTLGRWLRDGEPVFALVQLSDLDPRGDVAAPGEHGAAWLRPHLAPYADADEGVADALAKAERSGAAALADLDALLRRRRGAGVARAWRAALRDGRASALDAQLGRLLDVIADAGRMERTLVVVQGLRGSVLEPPADGAGPRFLPDVMRTPLVLRAGLAGARGRHAGLVSAVDVPRALDALFDLELGPTAFAGADLLAVARGAAATVDGVLASEAGLARHVLLKEDLQRERAAAAGDVTFTREGSTLPLTGVWPEVARAQLDALDAFAAPATLTVRAAGPGAPPVEVRWQVATGLVASRAVTGAAAEDLTTEREAARGRSGAARLAGDAALVLGHSWRAADVRLDLLSAAPAGAPAPIGPGDFIAGDLLDGVLLPRLVVPRVVAWTEDDEPAVLVERADGVWWRVSVNVDGPCELLITVWPPRDAGEPLEVSAGGGALADPMPGRPDVVRVVGEAPFDLTVKKGPREEFALAARVAGVVVPGTRVRVDGRRQATETELSVVVPGWLPPLTDGLAPADPDAAMAFAAWRIERRDPAGVFGAAQALDGTAREILRRVPAGE